MNEYIDNEYKTASFCGGSPYFCVEVQRTDGTINVRDNKTGGELHFTTDEWKAFILGVKNGEFDV
jgi:hypothetical protein